MAKLTPGHEEQIRKMREKGPERKTYGEIIDFFRSTYKIKLYSNDIIRALKGNVLSDESKPPKRSYKRKGTKTSLDPAPSTEDPEFVSHIRAAYDIYKKGFFAKVAEAIT